MSYWWTAGFIRSALQDKTLSRDRDSGSSILWDVVHLVGVIGVIVGFTGVGHYGQGEQLIATSGFGLMVAGISLELHDRPKSVKLFLRGRLVVHHGRQFRDSWLSNRFRGWGQS
jgi:hypothetical protein